MANTYTQLFVHIVFAVQGRQNIIAPAHRETLHRYITTVLQADGHKMLAIFCMPDHVHLLAGINPAIALSDLVLDTKRASTNFINNNRLVPGHFHWQKGYGAFSYSKSQLPQVIRYILNQETHHQRKTFQQEYLEFLHIFDIAYNDQYVFEFYEG
ncbi:IS200/IS605 family transposase [Pseudocnuella soli]|uniref:IS200/IS605 family transposase n=1 Tax=Pseudocnuella soli TaxID=2502779 RepID=UPI001046A1A5|nr:IS200/IS605 family transposase [Pseudocnuella soli]